MFVCLYLKLCKTNSNHWCSLVYRVGEKYFNDILFFGIEGARFVRPPTMLLSIAEPRHLRRRAWSKRYEFIDFEFSFHLVRISGQELSYVVIIPGFIKRKPGVLQPASIETKY